MQKIAVCVSGGGTNLQAIIDAVHSGKIHNTQIAVVISNKADAYALERANNAGIPALCISPKEYENRSAFGEAMVDALHKYNIDLVVLAGYLVIVPSEMIAAYPNKIINIHPSLIPSFCGTVYGRWDYPAAYALIGTVGMLGSGVGIMITGFFKSYTTMYIFDIVVLVVALICCCVTKDKFIGKRDFDPAAK